MRVLISGAAGFLASHLTDLLLGQGHEVVGLDNFITGKQQNIAHLMGHKGYTFHQADVIQPVKVDRPRRPHLPHGQPGQPNRVSQAADRHREGEQPGHVEPAGTEPGEEGPLPDGQHQRVLRRTRAVNPQPETYWGNVNPIGLRSMYGRAQAVQRGLHHGLPPRGPGPTPGSSASSTPTDRGWTRTTAGSSSASSARR